MSFWKKKVGKDLIN